MVKAEKLNVNRDIYNVAWGSEGSVDGDVATLKFHNDSDGEKSVTTDANDGNTTVTVSKGYEGEDKCTVTGSGGGSFSFDVKFEG